MILLPIVERELRAASRRRGTFWARSAVGLVGIAIGTCIFCANLEARPTQVGQFVFVGLSSLAFFYCLFSGARGTADCLSVEKREGTLGLLFLTDLKAYDVVLGKIAATSLGGFYGLLAVVPVLAVPLMMGGISNAEFWRVILALVNTFLFSQAVGIFVSASLREARAVAAANILLLLLPTALLPLWAMIDFRFGPSHEPVSWLLYPSPGYSFILAFDFAHYSPRANIFGFWFSMGLVHSATWVLVLLACWIVPHSWQDRPVLGGGTGRREFWLRRRHGNPVARARLRKRLLDINAFYWLAARDRRKRVNVWIFLGLLAGAWAIGRLVFGNELNEVPLYVMTAIAMNIGLKLWIAIESGERLAADRATAALELLLSTPLSPRQIVRGQRLALQQQFLGPILLATAAAALLLCAAWSSASTDGENRAIFQTLWVMGLLMFYLDVVAIYWVGMHSALTVPHPNQTSGMTVLKIMVTPWLAFGAMQAVIGVGSYLRWFQEPGWHFYAGSWLALGLLFDLGFGLHARHQLLTRLRELPMRRLLRRKPRPDQ